MLEGFVKYELAADRNLPEEERRSMGIKALTVLDTRKIAEGSASLYRYIKEQCKSSRMESEALEFFATCTEGYLVATTTYLLGTTEHKNFGETNPIDIWLTAYSNSGFPNWWKEIQIEMNRLRSLSEEERGNS